MSRVQVIIRKDDRAWDSIRSTAEQATMRIASYMQRGHGDEALTMGEKLEWKLMFGKDVREVLENNGFTIEIKELEE